MTVGSVTVPEDVAPPGNASDSYSLINARTIVDGAVTTETDLQVDGQVTGQVQCRGVLYITEGARVDATVDAGGIVVEGALSGTIRCRGRLEIRPTGSVSGEVDTERLVIFEGAVYEGRLRMEVSSPPEVVEEPERPAANASPVQSNPYSYFRSSNAVAQTSPPEHEPVGEDGEPAVEDTEGRR
jgi:cytoskeletal protein CcmA (bactofilin family)